jgi:hypothetical protein
MVDNVAVTAGTGTTIAADDIGAGVLAQRVKPVWGPDGTGNDTDVATGKPLPIQLRGSDGTDVSKLLPVTAAQGTASALNATVVGTGTFATQSAATIADGASATLGAKADAKSTATDTTAVTAMSVLKQISASVQAPPSQAVTNAGTFAAQATLAAGSGVLAGIYTAIPASQTAFSCSLSSSPDSGATGDYLDHVVVIPATTAPGVVTILDSSTALISYPGGGTTALLTLTPFTIYVGAVSKNGAWKITTGANVSVLAVGKFS